MKSICFGLVFFLLLNIIVTPSTSLTVDEESDKNVESVSKLEKTTLFDRYISFLLKLCKLPSISACSIKDGEVVWANAYGFADIENEKEAKVESIYLVMSISKPVAATALMQLYEQGKFDLDDDVNEILPFSLRNPNYPDTNITYRMLLAHQSSLACDEEYPMVEYLIKTIFIGDPNLSSYPYPWLENYLLPGGDYYTPEVWVKEKPGTNYHYSNVGYGIVGYLVELHSNQTFNDYCVENIFDPLDMKNSSFLYEDLNNSNISIPYNSEKKTFIPKLKRQPLYSLLFTACANLKTTPTDLSHFVIAHMNCGKYKDVEILNSSTVGLMQTIQYPENKKDKYGLGWSISKNIMGNKIYGHGGGGPGVRTSLLVNPEKDTAVIYFINSWTWRLTFCQPLLKNAFFYKAKHP